MIKRFYQLTVIAVLFWILQSAFPAFAADLYTFCDTDGTRYYTNAPSPGRTKVRFPLVKEKSRPSVQVAAVDLKMQNYESLIVQAGNTHSIDPDLVRAVIKSESNFNPRAVSPKGARGLMQLMPQTARELGVDDPFDPASNIRGGVLYLSRLLDKLGGDLALSLAAYNAGLERVVEKKEIPDIRETKQYVQRVLAFYAKLKENNRIHPIM